MNDEDRRAEDSEDRPGVPLPPPAPRCVHRTVAVSDGARASAADGAPEDGPRGGPDDTAVIARGRSRVSSDAAAATGDEATRLIRRDHDLGEGVDADTVLARKTVSSSEASSVPEDETVAPETTVLVPRASRASAGETARGETALGETATAPDRGPLPQAGLDDTTRIAAGRDRAARVDAPDGGTDTTSDATVRVASRLPVSGPEARPGAVVAAFRSTAPNDRYGARPVPPQTVRRWQRQEERPRPSRPFAPPKRMKRRRAIGASAAISLVTGYTIVAVAGAAFIVWTLVTG